jgi:probable rRNA maturation factor
MRSFAALRVTKLNFTSFKKFTYLPRFCIHVSSKYAEQLKSLLQNTMILFDPDQTEAAEGFPAIAGSSVRAALPKKPTLARYLREAQAAVGLRGEVSVLLTTDAGIRGLNKRFRKKDKATDVLSFPVDDASFGSAGDLAISVETAARQAAEQGHRLSVELRVLMLHGLLHLAGLDHERDNGEMARKERRLRAKLGLPLGLIERVEAVANKKRTSGAKALSKPTRLLPGLKPRPTSEQRSTLKMGIVAAARSTSKRNVARAGSNGR